MTNWFELAVDICHGTREITQCDTCVGSPDDWCEECGTCLHLCTCDLGYGTYWEQKERLAERKDEGWIRHV